MPNSSSAVAVARPRRWGRSFRSKLLTSESERTLHRLRYERTLSLNKPWYQLGPGQLQTDSRQSEFAGAIHEHGDNGLSLLFIHGGFGHGKTHLLNAIALEVRERHKARALFLRAEDFMRRFLAALRNQETLAFKEVLRGWEESPGHNKNLLLPDATHMGIALVLDPKTEFKSFWTLVIGASM